ncbi:MAG TPA: hypothetical protein VK630_01095 [Reyranella sp.]|nr:hypothetical protein [Reyranella sp.]
MRSLQVRYSRLHNISMMALAAGMIGISILHFVTGSGQASSLTTNDPRFVLYAVLVAAMGYYAWAGFTRSRNPEPQLVIDHDGIVVGFGRNRRFAWNDILWVRLRRLGFRPQLQIGLVPEAFMRTDLRLSMWNLDDGLRPIRGAPAAVAVRDNGLDARASAMLDAVRSFRPNLVKS